MSEPEVTQGARLRAERERKGLSVAKAADELHLDAWVIDALEAEDYQRIGPSVYAKGHLKRYAGLLGLPADEVLAGYESRVQAPKIPVSQSANVRLRADAPAVSNLPWPQIAGSVAVLLLIIGVLWWKPWHQRGPSSSSSAPTQANASAAPTDNAADGADATKTFGAATPTPSATSSQSSAAGLGPGAAGGAAPMTAAAGGGSTAGVSTAAAATPAGATAGGTTTTGSTAAALTATDAMAGTGRARLRLSFSADSWVDVHDAAGRRAFAGKGRANSVKVIHGVAPMRVYLGFASGVQLEINDRAVAIGPQFVAGDVARFEAGADGILRRDSRNTRPPG